MECRAATNDIGLYRARNPRNSPLYRCVAQHGDELRAAGRIRRGVEEQALDRFLDCGDLHQGFARIHCDNCGHDYLLAFSCKTRCFCPSCDQKRMLIYGQWVEDEVLAPVPHRQYVFTVPKVLRSHCHRRHRLGELCRIVGRLIAAAYREVAPADKPGFILFVQTFGDLVTCHPHIHALVADGVFQPNGVFRVLPPIPTGLLEEQFRRAVLEFLLADEALDAAMVERLLGWRHSGFSVDHQVRVAASDAEGRQKLARYMIRAPFSLEKMEYKRGSGVIVYRSKHHATLRRNFQIMPGAQWLELLLQHVPDRGEHLVRYYGWYSNRARGMRRAAGDARTPALVEGAPEPVDPELSRAAKCAWARLIKNVYEADPMLCPRCGAEMRLMAVIEEAPVVERILRHLGCWNPRPPRQAPPADKDAWPVNGQLPLTYCPLPDIA